MRLLVKRERIPKTRGDFIGWHGYNAGIGKKFGVKIPAWNGEPSTGVEKPIHTG